MTEDQFKQAERIIDKIRYLEAAHRAISEWAELLSEKQDKDAALALANMLIDLSKDRYGRWEIDLFVSTAISDIIEQIQEIRKELEEL